MKIPFTVKFILALLITEILVNGAFTYFAPELFGLPWHLRHRSRIGIGNYQIQVPFFSEVNDHWGCCRVEIGVMPGRFRARVLGNESWGFRRFEATTREHSGAEIQQQLDLVDKPVMKLTGVKHFVVAGQPTLSFERSLDIQCYPESEKQGIYASFFGSKQGAIDFYDSLANITRLK